MKPAGRATSAARGPRTSCLASLSSVRVRARRFVAGLAGLAVAGLLVAATPLATPALAPIAGPAEPRTILLLGCRVFGGSERVARQLDDMAAATDVLGDTRFVIDVPADGSFMQLPVTLARHADASVAVVIVGDLSVLRGIDPSLPSQATEELTSRDLPEVVLRSVLDRLEGTARAQGTTLLLATAPLGRQAHVEVPELDAVAELLRQRSGVLDLARDFRALEPALLFDNGLDRLDDYGHDALARLLFERCLTDDGLLPARDAAERAARLQARALAAFHADHQAEFASLAGLALGDAPGARHDGGGTGRDPPASTPDSPRHAARLAAIASARDGLVAAAPRWDALTGPATGVPGLGVGRALIRAARVHATEAETAAAALPAESLAPGDAFEAELVAALDALTRGDAAARDLGTRTMEAHPERLAAWLVLQFVTASIPPVRDVRSEARRHLALCPRDAIPEELVTRIFRHWPDPVDDLPALLLAERPWTNLLPSGPLLETARRRAAIGFIDHALEVLSDGLRGLHAPPSWERERQRIEALPRD